MVSKITLSVCKVYKNTGRFRSHRKKTKPAWKHYFLSDDYTDEWKFYTEWIDSVTAQFLKLKRRHKKYFQCRNCGTIFYDYVKKNTTALPCPRGCDEEEEDEDD